jgi:hypothetical protein
LSSRWPNDVPELVSSNFLKSVPVAQATAVSQALADNSWEMALAQEPVFILRTDNVEACREMNQASYGLNGVLRQIHLNLRAQCFGADESALTTIHSRSPQHLQAVATAAVSGGVVQTPLLTSAAIPPPPPTWLCGRLRLEMPRSLPELARVRVRAPARLPLQPALPL